MTTHFNRTFLLIAALSLPIFSASGQTNLTGISVFSADASGNFVEVDTWVTKPGQNFEIWIRNGGGTFLNGPANAASQPNIPLPIGVTSFSLYADPGADFAYFGINLFFDGSVNPSISAFGPMLATVGPHNFKANSSLSTPRGTSPVTPLVPGAGTLSFTNGDKIITLTDFYWATPSVFNQDLADQLTRGANGTLDYVGGITFSVHRFRKHNHSRRF